jgi:hypothetical protein
LDFPARYRSTDPEIASEEQPTEPLILLGESTLASQQDANRPELRSIATYQKGILICILVYLIAVVARFALPPELRLILTLGMLPVGIASTVFVFLLSTKIYSTGTGVLLGILTLIPVIGLIVLLIINGKATAILRRHGIRVGLLGASLSGIK